MVLKYGVNTFIWAASFECSHLPLLAEIKAHGFDGVELPLLQPARVPVREIRKGLAENGLECTFCSVLPSGLSLIAGDPEVRRAAMAHLSDCVKVAADIGGEILAGPLYSPVGYLPGRRRTQDEVNRAVEAWQTLGDTLAANRVTVALKPLNRFETYFLNTVADAVALCRSIGNARVGVLFDTFHANVEEKNVAEALRSAGPFLKHLHMCENDRGIPGSGHVDWPGVFRAIRELNYSGWLTIESFGFALGELSAAASIWRDLAPEPQDIAYQGVEFLKKSWNTSS
jgi:D-psicose/D-tagatose/L-ribulose 3-epimerase